MGRALLGDHAVLRIRRATGDQIADDNLLVRNDDEEHVGRHDRRGEGAEMQEGGAAGEELRVTPGHADEDEVQKHHQPGVVAAEGRLADRVIGEPAEGDRAQ
ncbi:hypothetical protein D9M70_622070 [compost metagenome]